jgi:hypothetical protein
VRALRSGNSDPTCAATGCAWYCASDSGTSSRSHAGRRGFCPSRGWSPWTKESIGVHRSGIAPRGLGLARETGRPLEAVGNGRSRPAWGPCPPWSWVTSLAPGRSGDGREAYLLQRGRAQRPSEESSDWKPVKLSQQSARHGRAARGLPGSRGRAQDTSGAQAQRADHSHPAERPRDRGAIAARPRPAAVSPMSD